MRPLDWHLNDKNTFGFSGFGMTHNEDGNNTIDYRLYNAENLLLKDYSRLNLENGDHHSIHLGMDYQHEFDNKGNNLMVSLSYSNHDMNSGDEYIQTDTFTK
jgi:uncharacterized cupin superfamily protein